jgi:phosphohistidine swiveling domain-containing protein
MTALLVHATGAGALDEIGGKAAALVRLVAAGFDVPPFVTLTPAAFAIEGLNAQGRSALADAIASLGAGPFAVRSSAREEDGACHSHAGQFLSLLGVAGVDLPGACAQVWQSGMTEGLRAYRRSRGLDPEAGGPAVIVQRLVAARAAGVAFSADPVSGRRDRIVLSAVAGLGDRLVGGEVDGASYVLDKATGALLTEPAGGPLTVPDLAALRDAVLRIEAVFGGAQDVEWAFEGARLLILQARPITTALRPAPVEDAARLIFDNSNIVESYPGLVSPLTYSFAAYVYARVYRMFLQILGLDEGVIRAQAAALENMLARIDGRVYYNLINWYRVLALLPGFSINRSFMEQMMGVAAPLPAEIVETLLPRRVQGFARWQEWGRIARVASRLLARALGLEHSVRAFHGRLQRALAGSAGDLAAMPLSALAAEYRRIEAELLDRWDAPLVNDFLCMIAFGASRKLAERWAGAEGLALHSDIMIGQGDIISAEPAQRIARMAQQLAAEPTLIARLASGDRSVMENDTAVARELRDYIARFGDRCTEELKLESRTLDENPTPLLAAVAAAARNPARSVAARPDAMKRLGVLLAGRPVRRLLLLRLTAWAKSRVRDRENLRFERTRVFGRARRLFRAIGRQFVSLGFVDREQDVFLLTVQEVLGAIEGSGLSGDLAALVRLRQAEQERAAAQPDPPERFEVRGAALSRVAESKAPPKPAAEKDALRVGTGCSAGVVTAVARVVGDPQHESLLPGEILVARHTDPGWIALFSNAAAIVVERGSLLSHSAIVARELGIPCVVGLKGATAWLTTGDVIKVDGGTGRVERRHD